MEVKRQEASGISTMLYDRPPHATRVEAGGEEFWIAEYEWEKLDQAFEHIKAIWDVAATTRQPGGVQDFDLKKALIHARAAVSSLILLEIEKPPDWFHTKRIRTGKILELLSAILAQNLETFASFFARLREVEQILTGKLDNLGLAPTGSTFSSDSADAEEYPSQ